MSAFNLASPFWVNLLILVPILFFIYWRGNKLNISPKILLLTLIFGAAFGIIEASCVIYLRAATGLLPGFQGTVADVWRQSSLIFYNQELLQKELPLSLLTFEIIREMGTMVMLLMIGFIAANKIKERFAIFVWTFAVWDITYYLHLWITIRWPHSLTTPDVLFLIPVPWLGQVWLPILISSLVMVAVVANLKRG